MKTRVSFVLVTFSLVCIGLLPNAQAVSPPPDGGYPNKNTAEGQDALFSLMSGTANTANGSGALGNNTMGDNNTADGFQALVNNTTGSFNIALGNTAGSGVSTADDVICIGAVGADVSHSCYIGNIFNQPSPSALAVFVNSDGKLGTTMSSRRFKEDIKPMDKASEAILAVQPVTFRYKRDFDPTRTTQFGLVAEEVAKVDPDLVVRDKEGKPCSVRYDQVNAMLLNEFLKEHRQVQDLKGIVAEQQKEIEALTTGLQKISAQLAAASPSDGGLEQSKFATGRIRGGGPAPQTVASNQ